MIEIYIGMETGFILYNPKNNKCTHAEKCDMDRIASIVSAFPDMTMVIYAERDWKENIEELYFHAPQLRETARVQVIKVIDLEQRMQQAITPPVKKRSYLFGLPAGLLVGSLMLLPLASEYKESVAMKANTVKELAVNLDNSPKNMNQRNKFNKKLRTLDSSQDIKSVTYNNGKYKLVLVSSVKNAKSSYFGLPNSKITKKKKISNGKETKYLYEIGGKL